MPKHCLHNLSSRIGERLPNRQPEPIAQEIAATGRDGVDLPPYHNRARASYAGVTFTAFLLEQQRRIAAISTSYIPRPSQFQVTPNRRAVPACLPEPWHGTTNGYTTHRCRCHECRQAIAYYSAERRAARRAYKAERRAAQARVRQQAWFGPRTRVEA